MTLQSIPFDTQDITRVNKTKRHTEIHNSIQLNKPKQLNTRNTTNTS